MSLPFTIAGPTWFDQAACAGIADPDVFFPTRARRYEEQLAEAQTICAGCPVQAECLELALAAPELEGIWAGTNETHRRRIRNDRARSIA